VALVAFLAGSVVAAYSIAGGTRPAATRSKGTSTFVASANRCGIRVAGPRVLGSDGRTVYREPIRREANPNRIGSQVQCSGTTVWVVWFNGVAASQEGYVGARSVDRGRTWKLVFAERFFGVKAPHQLDSYLGVWTLRGPRDAYFTGTCPACGFGTVSLWVTENAGRTFHRYKVPALAGQGPTDIRVSGRLVTIRGRRVARKIDKPPFEIYRSKTVTLHVG
jgi:hypothetical protein